MRINLIETMQFHDIISTESIMPVYQPIVSLMDGSIFGYEALSRITLPNCDLSINELFSLANQLGQVWNLEKLCRNRSIKAAREKPKNSKLFLNVDANIIHDPEFITGFTSDNLTKYGLNTDDIVFEITERTAVEDVKTFEMAVSHYQGQGFHIGVDDVGSGYSGLNRICSTSPQFLKIDMAIIRDIHLDPFKKSLVSGIVKFCSEMGIYIIAEGIETEDELREIIRLGISYGQGYYFKKPSTNFEVLDEEQCDLIRRLRIETAAIAYTPSFFENIETICKKGPTMSPSCKALEAFELFKASADLTEICLVDDNNNFVGILIRHAILEIFAGQYGFNLNHKKLVLDLAKTDGLVIDCKTSIETVAKIAMTRMPYEIYDAVVVTKNGKYLGVVTIKDLLTTAVNIQVKRALDVNPLTELPGNTVIENYLQDSLNGSDSFTLIYIDIDNFKAYNDVYGFNKGDKMIMAVANAMKKCCDSFDFIGHIGGDDFVIITHRTEVEKLCYKIIDHFKAYIPKLFSSSDWEKGFIICQNRKGKTERFPITTLSFAAVTNNKVNNYTLDTLSKTLAEIKKQAKQVPGNSVVIV